MSAKKAANLFQDLLLVVPLWGGGLSNFRCGIRCINRDLLNSMGCNDGIAI